MLKKNILIVEDNKDVQEVYKDMLKDKYELNVVSTTKKAKELLSKEKFDLMILDIILPKESGDTFLVHLKDDPLFRNLKVIVVTVLGDLSENLQTIDPNILCLAKPFKKDDLLEMIAKAIR